VNDNESRFDKYEYEVEIKENLEKMSEIFRLNASDIDREADEEEASVVSYQLLNHLDKFYVDEQTGIIYNKITFDFEAMRNEASETNSSLTNQHQQQQSIDSFTNSFENLNSIQLMIRACDQDMLETFCILTIKITNVNDNAPQFERAFFSSHIQVDEDDDVEVEEKEKEEANIDQKSFMDILLDENTSETSTQSVQFVTKISAKDVDSKTLYYSILKQTQIDDNEDSSSISDHSDRSKLNQLAVNNLFAIEKQTGIVYINLRKYKLLKKFNQFTAQSILPSTQNKELTTFSLQLSVTDSMLTTHSRLTVQIESLVSNESVNTRPLFKTNVIFLNVNITKLSEKSSECFNSQCE